MSRGRNAADAVRCAGGAWSSLFCRRHGIDPLLLGAVEMGRELNGLVAWLRDADHGGSVVPDYMDKLPLIGDTIADWWRALGIRR